MYAAQMLRNLKLGIYLFVTSLLNTSNLDVYKSQHFEEQ